MIGIQFGHSIAKIFPHFNVMFTKSKLASSMPIMIHKNDTHLLHRILLIPRCRNKHFRVRSDRPGLSVTLCINPWLPDILRTRAQLYKTKMILADFVTRIFGMFRLEWLILIFIFYGKCVGVTLVRDRSLIWTVP